MKQIKTRDPIQSFPKTHFYSFTSLSSLRHNFQLQSKQSVKKRKKKKAGTNKTSRIKPIQRKRKEHERAFKNRIAQQ